MLKLVLIIFQPIIKKIIVILVLVFAFYISYISKTASFNHFMLRFQIVNFNMLKQYII